MAMASSTGRAGTRTRHGDGKREHSAVLVHLHPQLPKHRRKKSNKPLAASLSDLGIDLRRLTIGRYTFSCRLCQQQRRTAPMQIEITEISTTWSCRSCGEAGGFSFGIRRNVSQRALP
jgi:hypothetical protein